MFFSSKKWIGKTINNYKIIEKIGEGRYGICYLAVANENVPVVIKQFKPKIWRKNKEKNHYEAVLLSQIDHPAIPEFLGVINEKDFYGFIFELMPGITLEKLLFQQKIIFSNSDIFHIAKQLIDILKYLHHKGIVHRDLRIPNILLFHGQVSLVDFGLARWADNYDYKFDQDFSYLGDVLLYLHYSSFEKQGRKSRPWYKELPLTKEQVYFYKRLLRLADPYSSILEVEHDFFLAFSKYA